jgi:hypothetical protein
MECEWGGLRIGESGGHRVGGHRIGESRSGRDGNGGGWCIGWEGQAAGVGREVTGMGRMEGKVGRGREGVTREGEREGYGVGKAAEGIERAAGKVTGVLRMGHRVWERGGDKSWGNGEGLQGCEGAGT